VTQNSPLVSVIVPTYNNEQTIDRCLKSIVSQKYDNTEVIVVDNCSEDETQNIVSDYDVSLHVEKTSMPEARKRGADIAKGDYYFHVDSDMEVSKQVIYECVKLCDEEYDAVVIPERNIGSTFWANCTDFGKIVKNKSHIGNLRFVHSKIYDSIGGHDADLVAGEDRDVHIRAANAGADVGFANSYIYHNVGDITLKSYVNDRMYYSNTVSNFVQKHSGDQDRNIVNKKILLQESIKNPIHSLGFLFLNIISFIISKRGMQNNG